ncbi:MAG: hypothetical protein H6Q26_1476 [Bacteroidetes bacterium]|nr:hypothetical protein [Bacteroidota bacterium]
MKFYHYCLIIILSSSCTTNFGVINTDPVNDTTIAAGEQLTAAAYLLDGGREMGYPNLYLFQPMVQYVSGTYGMRAGGKYVRDEFYNGLMWSNYYGKCIKQLADLLKQHQDDSTQVNYVAAARILKVYIFSLLTDAYGDIPYSQAGLAVILNDIVYNGNLTKWKRMARSLQLRLAMRLSAADPSLAQIQAAAAFAGGVMQSNNDNFVMIHEDYSYPDLRGNGYAQALQEEAAYKYTIGTTTFVNYLKAENDPRLGLFFVNTDSITNYLPIQPGLYWWEYWSDFVGENGEIVGQANKYCHINAPFYQQGGSWLHLGYAEVELLLAEAAVRGWIGEDANTHYQSGLRAAMHQLEMYPGMTPLSGAAIDSFVGTHTLPSNAIAAISMQKWVALFPNGYEAFANQRRTGYPELNPIVDIDGESETGGHEPKRLFYPATEATSNPVHYQEAIDRLGGSNDWMIPVWWNK